MFVFILPFLSWIWSSIGKYVIGFGALAAAVCGFALDMFLKGKASAEATEAQATTQEIDQTKTADTDVSKLTDAQVAADLQKWESK